MSDFYTSVWKRINERSVDEGRFVIIDITDNSREEITEILNNVREMNPSIIGFDVSYISKKDPTIDSLLVCSLQSLPHLVLPLEYHDEQEKDTFLNNIIFDQLIGKEYGVVSFPENKDVIRTFRPSFVVGENRVDAFRCVIAEKCGADISEIRKDKGRLINYTTLRLSDDDAKSGWQFVRIDSVSRLSLASDVSGKIVLIGSTHHTSDFHMTPLGYSLSGIMIHAHVINSLLDNKLIKSSHKILRYVICMVLAILALFLYQKHGNLIKTYSMCSVVLWGVLIFLVSIILFACLGTFLYCQYCYYIDFAPYITTLIIVYFIKDKNFKFKNLCI